MITQLKNQLGAGARLNKYLLELAWGDLDSEKLSILCKSASLPEHKIATVTAGYHGRKVVLRGEHEYPETYEITIYDDANLSLRKFFDKWLLVIDDPARYVTKLTDGSNIGGFLGNLINKIDNIKDSIEENINDIKDLPNKVTETVGNWFYGYTGLGSTTMGSMGYAAPLYIWQLDHNNNKIYGYEMENAYPISLGSVEYSAEKQNEIAEYTVTFAFSDFIPISM